MELIYKFVFFGKKTHWYKIVKDCKLGQDDWDCSVSNERTIITTYFNPMTHIEANVWRYLKKADKAYKLVQNELFNEERNEIY